MKNFLKLQIKSLLMIPYSVYLYQTKRCIIKLPSKISFKTTCLEGRNLIHRNVYIENSEIGFGTYIGGHCVLNNSKIGRFCSIAWNVNIIATTHPTRRFVSTHPAFFSLGKQSGFPFVSTQKFNETIMADSKYSVLIGNDVWIGANTTILGGVRIGDGAIISTGSVVTKDVEPYSIVGGVPSKIIRYRFSPSVIEYLLNFKWWNKDFEWLKENEDSFSNIEDLMKNTSDLN